MNVPTLLFCVGATKAGTSWLYRYLEDHPACFTPVIKELHFFDAVETGKMDGTRQRVLERRQKLVRNQAPRETIASLDRWLDVLDAPSDRAYLDYMTAAAGAKPVMVDVTPAYSLLPVERLRSMAQLLPDMRFIYLLRDPVERLWSHIRMIAKRRGGDAGDLREVADRKLKRFLRGEELGIEDRGDYRSIIARLDAAIDPSRLFLAFYETLFSQSQIDRLCAFIGIDAVEAKFDRRVHEGVCLDMTEDQKMRARAYLAPQYEFAAERLGSLPEAWQANMMGAR
jgi:hypothetical protein